MSYDKLVDSAKLDGALSASANAIREKTSDTAQIAWDATTGFASAISAIESGSKIAEGQFIPAQYTGESIAGKPITISGLGFKPTRVIVYRAGKYTDSSGATHSGMSIANGLVMMDTDGNYLASYCEAGYDEEYDEYWEDWYISDPSKESYKPKITLQSNGFKISADYVGTYNELTWYPYAYRYIAFG